MSTNINMQDINSLKKEINSLQTKLRVLLEKEGFVLESIGQYEDEQSLFVHKSILTGFYNFKGDCPFTGRTQWEEARDWHNAQQKWWNDMTEEGLIQRYPG